MKQILVLEKEEKEIIKKASALINQYCNETDECENCPFEDLCTRIQNGDKELNVPFIFTKAEHKLFC